MNLKSATRFLKIYALSTILLIGGVVAVNYVIDPLRVYHAPWLKQRYAGDHRLANPGLARFESYDSVVVGTSMTENFAPSDIKEYLGWNTLNMFLPGATSREQRLNLDQALSHGRVKNVIWGIDYFVFQHGPEEVKGGELRFPFHLYRRDSSLPGKYLLSLDTLHSSLRCVTGHGWKSLEERNVTELRNTYGEDRAFMGWRKRHAYLPPEDEDQLRKIHALALTAFKKNVMTAIAENPDVQFHVFFPPYSVLHRVSELTRGNYFQNRMEFKQAVCRELATCKNVQLHDFEAAESTHDLSKYSDLIHYGRPTAQMMLAGFRDGTYRISPENCKDSIQQVEQATWQFAAKVFEPGSRYREPLKLDEVSMPKRLVPILAAGKPLRTAH